MASLKDEVVTYMDQERSPADQSVSHDKLASEVAELVDDAVQKTDYVLPGPTPANFWRTEQGFKWMKTIALAASTNLNTFLDGGRYDVTNCVNGPPGSATRTGYLLVEFKSNTIVYQEWTDTADTERMVRWGRIMDAGVWRAWSPILHRGWRTIEDYGDVPTTVGDNTQALVKLLRSGFRILITGAMRATALLSVGRVAHGSRGVLIQGLKSKGRLIMDGINIGGLYFDLGTLTRADNMSVTVRDLDLYCNGTNDAFSPAITVQVTNTDGAGGDTEVTHDIRNVNVRPAAGNAIANFAIGFYLNNARLGLMDNCIFEGRRSGWVANSCGFLLDGDATNIPVENTWRKCAAYFVAVGHQWRGAYEGNKLLHSYGVACQIGFKGTNSNANHADNMIIDGCHFSTSYVGIWAEQFKNSMIINNQMSGQNWEVGQPTYYGIFHNWNPSLNPTAQQHNSIRGNKIDASPIKAIRTTCTGLWIDGLAGAHTGSSHIGPNEYMGCIVGEHWGANAKQNWFDNSSKYDGTTTPRVITTPGANLAPGAMVTI